MPVIKIPLSQYIRWKIKKFWNLIPLAKKFDLSVVKQEILHNELIGLDTLKRKLLLVRKQKDNLDCRIVDIHEIQDCFVEKVYSSIRAGDLDTNTLDYYLESVSLKLVLRDSAEPIVVNFYQSQHNTRKQKSFLEVAARKWKQFISDLLPGNAQFATAF